MRRLACWIRDDDKMPGLAIGTGGRSCRRIQDHLGMCARGMLVAAIELRAR